MGLAQRPGSQADQAYDVLRQSGKPMYFRDLINRVIANNGGSMHVLAHRMAEVHTQINMDSRFLHLGKGMWGLAEWQPQRGTSALDEVAATAADTSVRREKLLEEIQEDYLTATADNSEQE